MRKHEARASRSTMLGDSNPLALVPATPCQHHSSSPCSNQFATHTHTPACVSFGCVRTFGALRANATSPRRLRCQTIATSVPALHATPPENHYLPSRFHLTMLRPIFASDCMPYLLRYRCSSGTHPLLECCLERHKSLPPEAIPLSASPLRPVMMMGVFNTTTTRAKQLASVLIPSATCGAAHRRTRASNAPRGAPRRPRRIADESTPCCVERGGAQLQCAVRRLNPAQRSPVCPRVGKPRGCGKQCRV